MEKPTEFEYPEQDPESNTPREDEQDPPQPKRSFLDGVPNPFYIISAALFVHGTVLPADGGLSPSTQVLLSLAYVLLCSVTTVWLIRRLRRWDDARSLVIIVTGMFLAISLELDDGLASLMPSTRWLVTGGIFLFAVGMFELIRRGCRIGLPRTFVAAFYAQWAVILMYPAAMSSDVLTARWQIAIFAITAAGGWLLYWPALGRAKPNSTVAWTYPMCPWALPVLTGVASLVRLYFLTVSFDPIPDVFYPQGAWNWTTILGLDFAVPFLLSLSLLLGESGRRARHAASQQWAVNLGVLSVLAAMCPVPGVVAADFRSIVAVWFDLPTVAVLGSILVLTFHWIRQIESSALGWIAGIVTGGLLLPYTEGAWSEDVGLGFLGTATLIGLLFGYRTRSLLFWSLGVAGIYLALFRHVPAAWAAAPYRIPEMSVAMLFALAAYRFRGLDQKVFASAAAIAWSVMLFPTIRGVFGARLPLDSLVIVAVWIAIAVPFVMRFGSLPLVAAPFALVLLGLLIDLLMRLLVDAKSGRVSIQTITLAGALLMFACGVALSREKTRRELVSEPTP